MSKPFYVGICGHANSGKDTLAEMLRDHLVTKHHLVVANVALADPMKDFCGRVYGYPDHVLRGPSKYRSELSPHLPVSCRAALQLLGTEWGRALHEDTWITLLLRETRAQEYTQVVIITDVRFPNEGRVIREHGPGIVVRVRRPGPPKSWLQRLTAKVRGAVLPGGIAGHASEKLQDSVVCEDEIINRGTLEDLNMIARSLSDRVVAKLRTIND